MPTLSSTGTPGFPNGTGGSVEGSFALSIPGLDLPANSAILVTFIALVDSSSPPSFVYPGEATFFAVGEAPEPSAVVSLAPVSWTRDTAQVVAIHFPDGFTGEYILGFVFDSWNGCGPFDVVFDARYSIIENVAAESLAPENFDVTSWGGEYVSEAATDLLFIAGSYQDRNSLATYYEDKPLWSVDPDTNFILQDHFTLIRGPVIVVGEERYSWVAAKVGTVSFTGAEEAVYVDSAVSYTLVLRLWEPGETSVPIYGDLEWTHIGSDVVEQRVYRGINEQTDLELIATLDGSVNTYRDGPLERGATYSWRVEMDVPDHTYTTIRVDKFIPLEGT